MKSYNKKLISYMGLFFVVLVWGSSPLFTLQLYKYYSPTFRVCFSELILLISYIAISGKHIKDFDLRYIKIGIPTGFFLALANITQKIGLMYTTPARYAFLENLSCLTVPVLMYFFVKKKPTVMTFSACFVCLASTLVLNGVSLDSTSWGIGEILCAISGLLYGFNIAGTSVYAKDLKAPLYLATQAVVGFLVAFISAIVFNFVTVPSNTGVQIPIEKLMFSFDPKHIIFVILLAIISSAFCWIIRTNAMKHIDANIVAVIMPFSAVITGILSVLTGKDILNLNLIFGSILGVLAIFLSTFDDISKKPAHHSNKS